MVTIKNDHKWLAIIALSVFIAYGNSLGGDFVYDDKRQIVLNALIQRPELYTKAITHDVWAFKGDGSVAESNYWRPVFTAWNIINFRLFGLVPFGWHVLNVLLHLAACLLAYFLLRRLDASPGLAFCISVIFAVHPVHTESVAWLAGSPDLLLGVFLLGSLILADVAASRKDKRAGPIAAAAVLYALALGSKEVAFLCFPLFYLIFARAKPSGGKADPATNTGIFAGLAAGYFALRIAVLGQFSRSAIDSVPIGSALLTVPAAAVFYLREMVLPLFLGPAHDVRPVTEVGPATFFLPLTITLAAAAGIYFLARRSFIQTFGAVLLICTSLLLLNLSVFPPEHLVQDRYLYLPPLGLLMIVVPAVNELVNRYVPEKSRTIAMVGTTAAVAILFAIKTISYNPVWSNELALWQFAVATDERSASSWSALGAEYGEQERVSDAVSAYTRSLAISPLPISYVGRAQNLIKQNKLDAALADLNVVTTLPPERIDSYTLFQAYEAVGVALEQKGDLAAAEKVLREARTRLPIYQAALTEKLAIILYNKNAKPDALRELEAAVPAARRETLPAAKAVFLRLGMLYAEAGRKDEARNAIREYLRTTESVRDKVTPQERVQAAELLKQLQ